MYLAGLSTYCKMMHGAYNVKKHFYYPISLRFCGQGNDVRQAYLFIKAWFLWLVVYCKVFVNQETSEPIWFQWLVILEYFVCRPTNRPAIQLGHGRHGDLVRGLVTERCAFIFDVLCTPEKNLFWKKKMCACVLFWMYLHRSPALLTSFGLYNVHLHVIRIW